MELQKSYPIKLLSDAIETEQTNVNYFAHMVIVHSCELAEAEHDRAVHAQKLSDLRNAIHNLQGDE